MIVTWLVRLRNKSARPRARGKYRLITGTFVHHNFGDEEVIFEHIVIVDSVRFGAFQELQRGCAEPFGVKRRMLSASVTFLPRMRSATSRVFCGVTRSMVRWAFASTTISGSRCAYGRYASARTRRAYAQPCSLARTQARADDHCTRRWCDRSSPARPSSGGSGANHFAVADSLAASTLSNK